jgi:hypothetical protein
VEMGDIPRPDSSVLLKNIFNDPKKPTSDPSVEPAPAPLFSSSNKRSLSEDESSNKRQRAESGDGGGDEDDSLVDAHLLSAAAIVRRPFT